MIFENNKSDIVEFDFKTMKMKINNKKYDSSWGEPHQHDDITYYDITKEIVMEFVCFSILKYHNKISENNYKLFYQEYDLNEMEKKLFVFEPLI